MAALQAGQAPQAQRLFTALLAQRPDHAAAHHFLGAALVQRGQLEAARQAMRRSLQLHPFQPSWLGNLAAIEAALGHTEAARQLREQQQRLRDGLPPWPLKSEGQHETEADPTCDAAPSGSRP